MKTFSLATIPLLPIVWPPAAFLAGPISPKGLMATSAFVTGCVTYVGASNPSDLGTKRSTAALVIWALTALFGSLGSIAVGSHLFNDSEMGATIALPLVVAGLVPSPFVWFALASATLICIYSTVVWKRTHPTSFNLTTTVLALSSPAWLAAAFRIWIAR